jgi:hypothetical protein
VAELVVAEAERVMRHGGEAARPRPPGSAVVIAPGQGFACEAGAEAAFAPWVETALAR